MTYPKRLGNSRLAALACTLAIVATPAASSTQSEQHSVAQAASGWTTETDPGGSGGTARTGEAQPPITLSNEQITLVNKINSYLNSLVHLQGRFVQTDHRNEETRGRFYVQRPGKLRFDYSAPSKLRIVSDGEYLAIEDHDLKTVDKFPLDATPIQLLLGEDVNLTRDAVILDMRQNDSAVVIMLQDKTGNAPGQIQLFFKRPELELYEWVVTDAQGLDTRIQLADQVAGEEKATSFFKSSSIELENLDNN